jgi:endonuclease VIII
MEGPHIRYFCEQLTPYAGRLITDASGDTKLDSTWLLEQPFPLPISRGKLLFLPVDERALRIHFLMFGDLRINREWPGKRLTLWLALAADQIRFYMSSVKVVPTERIGHDHPAELDITNEAWVPAYAWSLARQRHADDFLCDVLLDQTLFAGLGNKIKNEALFRARLHPLARVRTLAEDQQAALTEAIRQFTTEFSQAIRTGERVETTIQIYGKKRCPTCGSPVVKADFGVDPRRCFFCPHCQREP